MYENVYYCFLVLVNAAKKIVASKQAKSRNKNKNKQKTKIHIKVKINK